MREGTRLLLLGTALPWLACAAHHGPPSPVPQPTLSGRTSVRLLPSQSSGSAPAEVVAEVITPAYASPDNKLPAYPAYALKAGCRDGIVPMRVHIGSDGNVVAQREIPDRPLPPGPCHVAFLAALQGAVAQWKFAPAYRQTMTAGPDLDGDGRPDFSRVDRQSPVAIYVDFEFRFEVVEGKGAVRSR